MCFSLEKNDIKYYKKNIEFQLEWPTSSLPIQFWNSIKNLLETSASLWNMQKCSHHQSEFIYGISTDIEHSCMDRFDWKW